MLQFPHGICACAYNRVDVTARSRTVLAAILLLALALVPALAAAIELQHAGAQSHVCAVCKAAQTSAVTVAVVAVPIHLELGHVCRESFATDLPAEPAPGCLHSRAPPSSDRLANS